MSHGSFQYSFAAERLQPINERASSTDKTSAIRRGQTLKFMTETLMCFSLCFPLANVKRITFSEASRVFGQGVCGRGQPFVILAGFSK